MLYFLSFKLWVLPLSVASVCTLLLTLNISYSYDDYESSHSKWLTFFYSDFCKDSFSDDNPKVSDQIVPLCFSQSSAVSPLCTFLMEVVLTLNPNINETEKPRELNASIDSDS